MFLCLLLAVSTHPATGLQCITCTSDPETQPNPLCWGDDDGTISVNDTLENGQQTGLGLAVSHRKCPLQLLFDSYLLCTTRPAYLGSCGLSKLVGR